MPGLGGSHPCPAARLVAPTLAGTGAVGTGTGPDPAWHRDAADAEPRIAASGGAARDLGSEQHQDLLVRIGEPALSAAEEEAADMGAAQSSGPPDAVSSVSVVHRGTRLEVSWEAPARATHYDVTYYNHSSGTNARTTRAARR